MTPIVDGLSIEFEDAVTFERLNAADDGTGQAAFESLALPGHPSVVIFDATGEEVYRGFGVIEAAELQTQIRALVGEA